MHATIMLIILDTVAWTQRGTIGHHPSDHNLQRKYTPKFNDCIACITVVVSVGTTSSPSLSLTETFTMVLY
jgi:hypothetical protein